MCISREEFKPHNIQPNKLTRQHNAAVPIRISMQNVVREVRENLLSDLADITARNEEAVVSEIRAFPR